MRGPEAAAALKHLLAMLTELGDEEVRVLEFQAARLLTGQTVYAPLDLGNDARDWDQQIAEEQSDRNNYEAFREVQKWIRKEAAAKKVPHG